MPNFVKKIIRHGQGNSFSTDLRPFAECYVAWDGNMRREIPAQRGRWMMLFGVGSNINKIALSIKLKRVESPNLSQRFNKIEISSSIATQSIFINSLPAILIR